MMRELTVDFPLNRGFRWWVEVGNKPMEPSDVRRMGRFGDLTMPLAVICTLGKKSCGNEVINKPMS